MNDKSPLESPWELLRLHLCGREAGVVVACVTFAVCGFAILSAGIELHSNALTTVGALGVAAPCGLGWIVYDADVPAPLPYPFRQGEIARMSDEQFDRLLDEVDHQALMPAAQPETVSAGLPAGDDEFAQMVRDALDELPEFVQDELRGTDLAVTIGDDGWKAGHYGLYHGGSVAYDDYAHLITIYRDTLTESFGDDADELRRQVTITVRHEMAHHFGADEDRVREFGL